MPPDRYSHNHLAMNSPSPEQQGRPVAAMNANGVRWSRSGGDEQRMLAPAERETLSWARVFAVTSGHVFGGAR